MSLLPVMVIAATEAEKRLAIDNGLAWLATQQQPNGSWLYAGGSAPEHTATTAAVLLAFLDEQSNWAMDYSSNVASGFDYLLAQAALVTISPQTAGNPDSDGNGVGVKFVLGGANGRDTYVTGLVIPAFARSGTPTALVATGPLAGRSDGTGPAGAWTYRDVVVNATDYFAFGQNEASTGVHRGGWRYYANYGTSDNSTAQWPPIAYLFAGSMGINAPGFVKDELAYWIEYIQDANGCSGYDSPSSIPNEAKTGGLLIEMVFAGDDTSGNVYNLTNPDLLSALSCLNAKWLNTANATWDGNFGHPYAMWSIYKGLELTIGTGNAAYITNLHPQATARAGNPAPLDPGDQWTWWEDYNEYLFGTQNSDGSWSGYSSWTGPLATAWHINILAGTIISPPTQIATPIPAVSSLGLVFLSALLGFLAVKIRRSQLS
jgi:hypothetical protein